MIQFKMLDKTLLGFIAFAYFVAPPQSLGQLSKFSKVYPSQSIGSSGYQEKNFSQNNTLPGYLKSTFHETNAVPWTKPLDSTGVSSINTNRSTVSLSLASNFAKGTLSGGVISFPTASQSVGLSSVKIPTLGSSGLITNPSGAGFTATNGVGGGWRYNASYNQVDKPNTATSIGVIGAGEFSSQEGGSSIFDGGSISISAGNVSATPGIGVGTRVTMQIYTENTTGTENKRTEYSESGDVDNIFTGVQFLNQADSFNSQAEFSATARSSDYLVEENTDFVGGPVTSGGFDTSGGTVGDAFAITVPNPVSDAAPDNYYSVTTNQAGENAVVLGVTSTASNGPGYADQTNTAGGIDSAPITFTNTNNIATGNTGDASNTEMTTCSTTAFDCGGEAEGSTRAPFVKTLTNGFFYTFGPE